MEKKLYKIVVTLNEKGFTDVVFEFDIIKEGAKTYNIQRIDKWGDKINKYKKKEVVGVIDSGIFYNSITQISYGAWCFDKDIESLKSKCKDKATQLARSYEESLNKILKHLN